MTIGLSLGAPGIYRSAVPPPRAAVRPVRLDATGFVGLAWRGPVNDPVPVTSWSQFVDVFGGVTAAIGDAIRSCPGYLPRAVRAFFDQGGQIAWVCRVVPVTDGTPATARYALPGGRGLLAADEGSWGGRLQVTISYQNGAPLARPRGTAATGAAQAEGDEIALADVPALPSGTLLVIGPSGANPAGTLHWVRAQAVRPIAGGGRLRVLTVDPPVPAAARGSDGTVDARVVTATVSVLDPDPLCRRGEQVSGLGLHPDHPRFPARPLPPDHPRFPGTVLAAESRLVRTGDCWQSPLLPADGTLPAVTATRVAGGRDRFGEVDVRAFFDDDSPDGDLLDERRDHRGADRAGRVEDIGLLCVPDLSWDGAAHLDPREPTALAEIVARQRRTLAVAELRRRFVVLLDAPSRLSVPALTRWRAEFDSTYAAAYHPWLGVPGDDPGRHAVPVPPSAAAAGVIAARERRLGLPWGPANELAVGVVIAADPVPDAVHDVLHQAGINVFRAERDGFRLTAARTLSSDPRYRQLSVRRLMTMISLAVEREAQTLVFEPNTADLRATVTHVLTEFLRDLYRQGAFAGDTEQTSFFVRSDDPLNPPESLALGRLITEIGVAPSSPLEYLVLRISQDVDGTSVVTPVASPAAAVPAATTVAGAA